MAKCSNCGRRGLFLKLDWRGWCPTCVAKEQLTKIEKEHRQRLEALNALNADISAAESKLADTSALLREAMDSAKTQAQEQLARDYEDLKCRFDKTQTDLAEVTRLYESITAQKDAAMKDLQVVRRRAKMVKQLGKSIKYAWNEWILGIEEQKAISDITDMQLDDLIPEPDLNCLTVKQLKTQYTALRKQIIEICDAYESRYTNKANATIYKLMVLAMEAELENILHKLQFGKQEEGIFCVRQLTAKYYMLATEGNQNIAPTLKKFIGQIEYLYIEIIKTEYEYYVQRERAREEQRAIKEQMRQEAEERKRLEQERKKVEVEEQKYRQEIERITGQMQQAHDAELEALRKRLAEMTAMIGQVEEKKAEIINLQNGKAGTVYIISNIGSFGDDVFKIGMTRRLEPQERVNELGDASVPFPFDVHSFIFSEDAVALESALHKELNERRVNKVNLRKEFFRVSIDELRRIVEQHDSTAAFRTTALAEQYRQSMSIMKVPGSVSSIELDDDDDIA